MSQKFLRVSAGFTILSLVASVLNFMYYPAIARSLSFAQFGEVQVGIAFIMQAAALFTSLNILALFFAAQNEERKQLTVRLERFVIVVSILLAIIIAVFANQFGNVLQLQDNRLLYLLSFIFILNIPCATWLGSLQGNGQFIASGIISVVSSLTKIVAGVALILLGSGAYGALLGILAGTAIILPLAYFLQKEKTINFHTTFARPRYEDFLLFKRHPQLVVVFFSLFALALGSNVDVLFSKSLLEPTAAGQYAQLSTAGKITYFAAVPLAIILFERFIRKAVSVRKALGGYTVFVGLGCVTTILLQKIIMTLFFNNHTYDATTFSMLCVAFSVYSITTLLTYRLLAARQVWQTAVVSAVLLIMPVAAISGFANSASDIARLFLTSQVIGLLVASVLQYTKSHE